MDPLKSVWLVIHVFVASLATALFSIAFGLSVVQLMQTRRFRQSRQSGGGQLEKRVGVRIDTCREIDERLWRVREERARPAKAPAVIHGSNRSFKKLHVDPDRLPVTGH